MLKKLMVLWFITLLICSRVQAVELAIEERIGLGRVGEPVTCGVPLPEGWAGSVDELVLAIEGEPAPCEVRAVSYWPDGSLRWVHLDFQASVEAGASLGLTLDRGTPAAFESKLIVEESTGRVTVTTGRLKAEVLGPGFNVFNRVWINSSSRDDYTEQLVAPHKRGLVICAGGVEYSSANDQNAAVQVESLGPMRVVLKVQGILKSDTGESGFHFICRLYFYNDSPVVRLAYTFENRGPYVESSEYKVTLEGLHVELPTEGSHDAYYLGLPGFDTVGSLSSEQQEGYILTPSTSELVHVLGTSREDIGSPKQLKTDRIGWIGISAGSSGLVGAGLRDFWQMYPSSMEVKYEDGLLTAGLIPQRLGQTIDVYSGVARTHYLRFAFLPSEESEKLGSLLAACQKPLIAVADPEYYCRESMVFGKLNERNETLYPEENLSEVNRVDQALDRGFNTMLNYVDSRSKNSVTWESYGFLDWGDGMHYAWESGVQTARNIAWNHHYYDLPHMCCVEFVRSGDYRWLDFFLSRACHLMDVHVTHFNDGHRLNGANRYCPPTDHVRVDPTDSGDYTTARVYISPYANHHKTEGLFERYYLTGDERSLEVALKA
ncbi:MAG: hypothetical protein U9N45_05605, partial [Gemmatimonadota bacterium]|nr:hypothetical protein [Gemmatimonadota bacterium]